MNHRESKSQVRKLQWRVELATTLLITLFVAYFYLFRDVSFADSVIGWFISNSLAWGVILFLFQRIRSIHFQLDQIITDTEKQAQRDATLAQLSGGFAVTLTEDEVCQELVDRLYKSGRYDHVVVLLLDPYSRNRVLRAEATKVNIPPKRVLAPGEGLSERAILDLKPNYTPDVSKTPRYTPGLGKGSEIDIPIIFDGEALGTLIVESNATNAYDDFDIEILTIIAEQASLALTNARLMIIEKARRQKAEVLQRAMSTLTSDLELEQVLKQILEQLKQVVTHDSACIFFWENDTIHAMAARGLPKPEEVIGVRYPADNPLFNLIIETRQPIILNDIRKDPRFLGWGGTQGMESWMGVPLIANDKIIGYLTLDSRQINTFESAQVEITQIFADHAAIAIENARLYQHAKESSSRQEVLHQVSQEMIRTGMNADQIYEAIHRAAAQLMPAESFVISILNEETAEIVAAYLWDKNERHEPQTLAPGRGLSWHVIETGDPVLAYDYYNQQELASVNAVHFGSDDHIRSVLAIPMRLGGKVIGMLSAQSYQAHYYTIEDQNILEMLAAYAAIAIDNAHLFSEVQRLAITDSLTGVYNRRHFFSVAQKEIMRARRYKHPISIMMLDLDYYKEINDTYGHVLGDLALKQIAEQCNQNIRKTDILARYGGDEFIILLPETDIIQCEEIAERLRKYMELNPITIDDTAFRITLSVGISGTSKKIPELNFLLKCADAALYQAKASGRNCVKFQTCK
ncbi:MAG TPA: hypothetical protein DEH22_00090 [Chloroflexi bacterium]|nr:hypothetical protein [Chloroflexota bacterium]